MPGLSGPSRGSIGSPCEWPFKGRRRLPFVWTDRNSLDVDLRKDNLGRASNTPLGVCTEGNRAYINNASQRGRRSWRRCSRYIPWLSPPDGRRRGSLRRWRASPRPRGRAGARRRWRPTGPGTATRQARPGRTLAGGGLPGSGCRPREASGQSFFAAPSGTVTFSASRGWRITARRRVFALALGFLVTRWTHPDGS